MRVWGAAHAVDDLYQGLVPASVPYFVLDRHYGYVAASGLSLAATLGAALPQPMVGLVVDRYAASGLAPAGVGLAGVGVGLSGLVPGYTAVWAMLFASGLGVAMFHPAAGKAARRAAGESAAAMSVFATGGNVGFFVAPVLATPALDALGVGAMALFLPPAVLAGFVLLRRQQRVVPARRVVSGTGADRWRPFLLLTAVEVTRSVNFFGISIFIELYWLTHLGATRLGAGAALTCFLAGGMAGTLLGGRIADRHGLTRTGFGAVAASHGLAAVFTVFCLLPVPATLLARLLPEPGRSGARCDRVAA